MKIAFNRPQVGESELRYLQEVIGGGHLSGDGAFTKKCQNSLEELCGAEKALLTTSCTDALEMCALLLDLAPGDEVILPSFTFVSSANAFVLRGAVPRFVDVRPDTKNIDERKIEERITPKTKAIVVVHYAGVSCAMDEILAIAKKHDLKVIEDNAHGFLGSYKGRPLGSIGSMATLSFHETKNFTSGEGGAILINDPSLISRAEIIREKGTNRSLFYQGQVDKYTWVDVGSSFLPSEVLSAILWAQLERREQIQKHRKQVWSYYFSALHGVAKERGVGLPEVPEYAEQAYHMFYMILPTEKDRNAFIAHMKQSEIVASFHYLPLHTSKMGVQLDAEARCPLTEDLSGRLVRLPFHNCLTESEQRRVCDAAISFLRKS